MKEIDLHKPDEEVVEKLEMLLRRAKRGEIYGFVFVGEVQGGLSCMYRAGPVNRPMIIGQLELLKCRILHDWMEDAQPYPDEESDDDD